MSGGYLLDTNVVIDVLRAPAGAAFSLAVDAVTDISALTEVELRFGVAVAGGAEQVSRLNDLTIATQRWDPIPVDEQVARSYSHVAAAIVAIGRQPRPRLADALIAATAHAYGLTLVTNNLDDFAGLDHLIEVVPFTVVMT